MSTSPARPSAAEPVEPTTRDELDAVVRRAARAAARWGDADPAERVVTLRAVADELDAAADDLVPVADAETSLGPTRLAGEVARTTGQLRMFAEMAAARDYLDAIITPADASAGRPDVRRVLVPIGPVAVFGASNFPFAFSVAGGDTASALAAGCPVVVKAHEGHPRTSRRVAEIVSAAIARTWIAPEGVFDIVFGRSAGAPLVQHPGIRAVGFTGSTAGGRALFDLAAARPDPIPFHGELGSVNPVVVLPDAARSRPAEIAAGYAASLTLGVGQFCTNPGLLFIPDHARLRAELTQALAQTRGGPMLSASIARSYDRAVQDPAWTGLDALTPVAGAAPGDHARPDVRTIRLATFRADPARWQNEIFGPAGLVVTYSAMDELIAGLGVLHGSLTASVQAEPSDPIESVAAVLGRRAGRLIMNGWPTGVAPVWAMHHGGPWPATISSAHTSVGLTAGRRWLIPRAYQDWPDTLLPPALQQANPWEIRRLEQTGPPA